MNSKESSEAIQELQVIEQNLQSLLMQKQQIQLEFNEISNAHEELKKTNDEVYRILGGIMMKSDKSTLLKELEEKKKVLDLRIKAIEKQEALLNGKVNELRSNLSKSMKSDSKEE